MKKDTPMMVMIDQYRQVVDEVPSGKKTSGWEATRDWGELWRDNFDNIDDDDTDDDYNYLNIHGHHHHYHQYYHHDNHH